MENRKVQVKIGNKVLSLDNPGEVEDRFIKEFEQVAESEPASIQEFFERLVELQRTNSLEKEARQQEEEHWGKHCKPKR